MCQLSLNREPCLTEEVTKDWKPYGCGSLFGVGSRDARLLVSCKFSRRLNQMFTLWKVKVVCPNQKIGYPSTVVGCYR